MAPFLQVSITYSTIPHSQLTVLFPIAIYSNVKKKQKKNMHISAKLFFYLFIFLIVNSMVVLIKLDDYLGGGGGGLFAIKGCCAIVFTLMVPLRRYQASQMLWSHTTGSPKALLQMF